MKPVFSFCLMVTFCVVCHAQISNLTNNSTSPAVVPTYNQLISAARQAMDAGRLQDSLLASLAAMAADDSRFEAYAVAVLVKMKQGQPEEAKKFLAEARKRAPQKKQAKLDDLEKLVNQEASADQKTPVASSSPAPIAAPPIDNAAGNPSITPKVLRQKIQQLDDQQTQDLKALQDKQAQQLADLNQQLSDLETARDDQKAADYGDGKNPDYDPANYLPGHEAQLAAFDAKQAEKQRLSDEREQNYKQKKEAIEQKLGDLKNQQAQAVEQLKQQLQQAMQSMLNSSNQILATVRQMAEQGDRDAQFTLGVVFENGWGLDKDFNQAENWYRKAAEQGDQDAAKKLNEIKIAHHETIDNNKNSTDQGGSLNPSVSSSDLTDGSPRSSPPAVDTPVIVTDGLAGQNDLFVTTSDPDFEKFFSDFAETMQLSDDQMPKVRLILQDYWKAVMPGIPSNLNKEDFKMAADNYSRARESTDNKLKSVLTPEQWGVWLNYNYKNQRISIKNVNGSNLRQTINLLGSDMNQPLPEGPGEPKPTDLIVVPSAEEIKMGAKIRVEDSERTDTLIDGYKYKLVEPGDTLSAIAAAYCKQGVQVSVEDILEANPGLDANKLKVGNTICIPDQQAKQPDYRQALGFSVTDWEAVKPLIEEVLKARTSNSLRQIEKSQSNLRAVLTKSQEQIAIQLGLLMNE